MASSQTIELSCSLQEAFPRDLIARLARESGVVIRRRDFDPVVFFWALMGSIIGGSGKSIASVKREYERLRKKKVDQSRFYSLIGSKPMVAFVRLAFAHAVEHVFPEETRPEVFKRFARVLTQDSSVVRLRDKLAGRLPGAGTAAALKVNIIVNAGGGKPDKVQLAKGTKAEVKFRVINKSLAGTLVIADLGYYDYQDFARIENNGGYFLSRLKDNANPLIVGSGLAHRGQALDLAGKRLRDVIGQLARSKVDLIVEIPVDLSGQPGPIPIEGHRPHKRRWRVVGLRNPITGEYHLYLTNIPPEWLDADDIALAYQQRWEVELLFKELKGCYDLGAWKVTKEESVMVQTYGVLIAWALSRRLRANLLGKEVMADPRAASLAAPFLRFTLALAVHIKKLIESVLVSCS